MTIIIGFKELLFADSATVHNSIAIPGRKIHRLRDDSLFAIAGHQPTRHMLEAERQADVIDAFVEAKFYFRSSSMLTLGPDGLILTQSYDKGGEHVQSTYVGELAVIGSYQNEALNRLAKCLTLAEKLALAERFVGEVDALWGLSTRGVCDAYPPCGPQSFLGTLVLKTGEVIG